MTDSLYLVLTVFLVILNGYFVAVEFAMVKLNKSKIEFLVTQNKPFAKTGLWLMERQGMALSAAQLGITMASLGLGWVGEPAFARIVEPLLHQTGWFSDVLLHTISFILAFSTITFLHIVIGEQVPKIYAIENPEPVYLYLSPILKFFYILLYPFNVVLDKTTSVVLKWFGHHGGGGHDHDSVMTEEEIKQSLSMAYHHGNLYQNEHNLLSSVFNFDNLKAYQTMVPRQEIDFINDEDDKETIKQKIQSTPFSRLPLVKGSLDEVIGIVHLKDLLLKEESVLKDLTAISREIIKVSRNMLLSDLLSKFKSTRSHLALVQDEFGTVIGLITIEDVVEYIVGEIHDEFDQVKEKVQKLEDGSVNVVGDISLIDLKRLANVEIENNEVNSLAGYVARLTQGKVEEGMTFDLPDGEKMEILRVKDSVVKKVKIYKSAE